MEASRLKLALAVTLSAVLAVGCSDSPTVYVPQSPPPPVADPDPNAGPPVIAFVSTRDGSPFIYVATAEGTGLRRLAPGQDPAGSWDGEAIAFTRGGSPQGPPGIYVMGANGENPRYLGPGTNPSWSPDGRIVFDDGASISVMQADGSDARLLVRNDFHPLVPEPGVWVAGAVYEPHWSPDGSKIAFRLMSSSRSGEPICSPYYGYGCGYEYTVVNSTFIANADGSDPRELSPRTGSSAPSWSPDGAALAVADGRFIRVHHLVSGHRISHGIDFPRGWSMSPARPDWSPDGRELFLELSDDSRPPTPPYGTTPRRIFAVSLATGQLRRVIRETATPTLAGYEDFDATWLRVTP